MEYEGSLSLRKKLPKKVKKAYVSYLNQRQRCINAKHPSYPRYGGRGIKVTYSCREFVAWWLSAIKNFDGIDPTVSRINHDDDYRFDNIRIESRSENSKERLRRNPHQHRLRKPVYIFKNGKFIRRCASVNAAAKSLSVTASHVSAALNGRVDNIQGIFTFSFDRDGA